MVFNVHVQYLLPENSIPDDSIITTIENKVIDLHNITYTLLTLHTTYETHFSNNTIVSSAHFPLLMSSQNTEILLISKAVQPFLPV